MWHSSPGEKFVPAAISPKRSLPPPGANPSMSRIVTSEMRKLPSVPIARTEAATPFLIARRAPGRVAQSATRC